MYAYPRDPASFWGLSDVSEPCASASNEPSTLFMSKIEVIGDTRLANNLHHPLLLLTHKPLPFDTYSFEVLTQGETRTAEIVPSATPAEYTTAQMSILKAYTLRLLSCVMDKSFTSDNPLFYVVPGTIDDDDEEWICDWNEAGIDWMQPPTPVASNLTDPRLKGAVLKIDTNTKNHEDMTWRIQRRMTEHRISSRMPPRFRDEIAEWKHKTNNSRHPSFQDFFKYKFGLCCKEDEAVFLVASIHRTPWNLPTRTHGTVPLQESQLVPSSLCHQFPMPASTYITALLVPAVMHELERVLLVQDFQQSSRLTSLDPALLRLALTPSICDRTFNNRKLKTIGNIALKFFLVVLGYVLEPDSNQGGLTRFRNELMSNKSLHKESLNIELFQYISEGQFFAQRWHPPSFNVNGKEWDRERRVLLPDKALSDAFEAVIGAAVKSGDPNTALYCLRQLNLPFGQFHSWTEFGPFLRAQKAQKVVPQLPADDKVRVKKLEKIFGYNFQDPSLAIEGLTDISAASKNWPSYERLECLGDGALDFFTIRFLDEHDESLQAGSLATLKALCVENNSLGAMAVEWGLQDLLKVRTTSLIKKITNTTQAIKTKKQRRGQYWHGVTIPKHMADVVESMFGALLEDCSFDCNQFKKTFDRLVASFIDNNFLDNNPFPQVTIPAKKQRT